MGSLRNGVRAWLDQSWNRVRNLSLFCLLAPFSSQLASSIGKPLQGVAKMASRSSRLTYPYGQLCSSRKILEPILFDLDLITGYSGQAYTTCPFPGTRTGAVIPLQPHGLRVRKCHFWKEKYYATKRKNAEPGQKKNRYFVQI